MPAKFWRKRQIMTHIEPCPFCGHVGLDFSEGSTYRWGEACCSGCGATCGEVRREYPDKGEWHQEAIMQWNTRAKQREWVGLTQEEKQEWIDAMPYDIEPRHCMNLINVTEVKLKQKNLL